jgi:hypothetical protein
MSTHRDTEPAHQAPGEPPQDEWMRRAAEAFADASVFEAIRGHAREGDTQCVEWCPICRTADLLRANATPELREQWTALQREALLTVRSLVDHYLDRVDDEPRDPSARVQDIPID